MLIIIEVIAQGTPGFKATPLAFAAPADYIEAIGIALIQYVSFLPGKNTMELNRIIVVDDDPVVREVLLLNLQSAGFHVTAVSNGTDALGEIARQHFDLVVLDIMMPEVDGWEVCKLIRDDPAMAQTKILMLSARSANIDKIIGKEIFKANEFVTKPFDIAELLHIVRSLLNGSAS